MIIFTVRRARRGISGRSARPSICRMKLGPVCSGDAAGGIPGECLGAVRFPDGYGGQARRAGRSSSSGRSLSTEIHRVFDVGGAAVEKIRHGIKPEITYTFIPDASQDNAPDFLARIPSQNSLTYALTNTLLSRMREKDGKISYREMMRFKLAQTYDIQEARSDTGTSGNGSRPFGDVTLELDLSPLQYLSLSARNIYNVNSGDWTAEQLRSDPLRQPGGFGLGRVSLHAGCPGGDQPFPEGVSDLLPRCDLCPETQ